MGIVAAACQPFLDRAVIRRPLAATCAAMVLAIAALAGCGQRGDLYLREKPPPGLKPERPAPYKPVPYPQSPGEDNATGSSGR